MFPFWVIICDPRTITNVATTENITNTFIHFLPPSLFKDTNTKLLIARIKANFNVLLTVQLSITLVIDQLNAQIILL